MVEDGKMDKDFGTYFVPNEEASYFNQKFHRRMLTRGMVGVRRRKAHEQRNLAPMSGEQVIAYANEFFEKVREEACQDLEQKAGNATNGAEDCGTGGANDELADLRKDCPREIELDGKRHPVVGNCLIVRGCDWKKTEWKGVYARSPHDAKYDMIAQEFGLRGYPEIVWLKFACEPGVKGVDAGQDAWEMADLGERYVGVVADSPDVNFDYENTSGKLLKDVGLEWDESCVCIFPLTEDLLACRNRKELETGLGNYLIARGVPIIDYYSHNNFKQVV